MENQNKFESPLLPMFCTKFGPDDGYGDEVKRRTDIQTDERRTKCLEKLT